MGLFFGRPTAQCKAVGKYGPSSQGLQAQYACTEHQTLCCFLPYADSGADSCQGKLLPIINNHPWRIDKDDREGDS